MDLTGFAFVLGVTRDVLIILISFFGLLAVLVIYRKVTKILDSAGRTLKNVEDMADSLANSIVKPANSGSGLAFGVGKLAAFVMGLSRRKKRKGGHNDG